jgi:leader peptidase (prepilin peptidase) / N-methyltransferase
MSFYILLFTFILGTAIGSFLNVWSRRLLKGETPTGRSKCESCGHVLAPLDLIPLLSFILLCGRCRYCKAPLSRQYPTVEMATGLWFSLSLLITNYELLITIPLLIASSALIVIFITDLKEQVIFDQTLWVALAAALLYRLSLLAINNQLSAIAFDLLAAFAAFSFFWLIRFLTKGRGMGEGDAPLVFILALLVGFPQVLVLLFIGFTLGGLVGAVLVALRLRHLKDKIAFGPFLVAAAFLTISFGEKILAWYLGILGV